MAKTTTTISNNTNLSFDDLSKKDLLILIKAKSMNSLAEMVDTMAETGEEYTYEEMSKMTDGFLSADSIRGYKTHSSKIERLANEKAKKFRYGTRKVEKHYACIDEGSCGDDIITITREKVVYSVR